MGFEECVTRGSMRPTATSIPSSFAAMENPCHRIGSILVSVMTKILSPALALSLSGVCITFAMSFTLAVILFLSE